MNPERWQEIKKVYEAALERDAGERAAFLEKACTGDEGLRREVESLLAYEKGAEDFIKTPALEVAAELLAKEQPPSMIGRKISHYQIVSLLGAGGMGEVYLAEDLQLRRKVALKLLPAGSEFASDPSRLARFEREARALAALNHPHVAAIYGLENADGIRFLVMELVEGPTLAERLSSGPLQIPEALRIATEIAEALEAAHEKGVIHRDLKPANIQLTSGGRVKVLDFGLAKIAASQADDLHTDSIEATRTRVVLGTAAYMSPEQAEGRQCDKRTDIWSFGVVLYEMLTGRRCFDGKTVSRVIVQLTEQEPDWQALPASLPSEVHGLLERCLAKDPNERLRDIGDVRIQLHAAAARPVRAEAARERGHDELKWVAEGGSQTTLPTAASIRRTSRISRWALAGLAVVVVAVIAAGLASSFLRRPSPSTPIMRLAMGVEPAEQLTGYQ
jgi:eukaryotic-like serine/threonine-protein kinase